MPLRDNDYASYEYATSMLATSMLATMSMLATTSMLATSMIDSLRVFWKRGKSNASLFETSTQAIRNAVAIMMS